MRRSSLAILVVLFGCGGETPGSTDSGDSAITDSPTNVTSDPPASCPTELTVDPGTGLSGYQPLADGDSVTIIGGAQGLYHIDVSILVNGSASDAIAAKTTVYWPEGDMTLTLENAPTSEGGTAAETYVGLFGYDAATCSGTFWGLQAVLVPPPGGPALQFICGLNGDELELSVEVTDIASGGITSGTRTVVARTDAALGCN